jgi:uncharacterized protein YcaQ
LGAYDPALVSGLYEPRLALTEYMAHAAAIIPVEDLALFRSFMQRRRARADWAAEPENRALMDAVLQRIATDGPLASKHFERPDDGRRAQAWEWYGLKPERRALDELWMRGETVLRRRESGFNRVFDLPERVIPGLWESEPIPDEQRDRRFLTKALSVLGVATAGWLSDYYRTGGPGFVPIAQTRRVMPEIEAQGDAIRVVIPGIDEPVWMDPRLACVVDEIRKGRQRPSLTTLLSPFDNLTWNRDRGERLFDFHYRLECYTPAPKRKYGYYSLPILYRGRIVGRLDPSYDRKTRFLTIRSLHMEPWVRPSAAMLASIQGAIEDLLGFLGGEQGNWALLRTNPPEILPLMTPEAISGPVDER